MPWTRASAVAPAGGTSQSIPLSCGGRVPVAVVVVATRATALDTLTAGAMGSIAISDGTTTRLGSCMAENGQLTALADTGLDYDNGTQIVRILATGDETSDRVATLTSFDVDGITISWTAGSGTQVQLVVFAFYGARMQAKVGAVAANTASDGATATVSGVAFRPVAMIQLGARGGFTQSGANTDWHLGFVAFNPDGTIQGQAGYAGRDLDRQATATSSGSDIRDDSIGERITGGTGGPETRYEVTSGTADGFVLTTHQVGVETIQPYALAYLLLYTDGGRANVGVIQLPGGSNSTGDKTVSSNVDGHPGVVFFIATALGAKNSYDNTAPCSNWSFGAGIPGVGSGNIGWGVADAVPASSTQCATSATHCIGVPDDSAGTDWSATFVSAAKGQFVVNVDDASPADRFIAFLSLEDRKELHTAHWRRLGARAPQPTRPGHGFLLGRVLRRASALRARTPAARAPAAHAGAGRPQAAFGKRQVNQKGFWVRMLRFWELQRRAMQQRLFVRKLPQPPSAPVQGVPASPRGSNALAGSSQGDNALAGSERGR